MRGGIGILNEWQFTRFTVCAPLLFSTTRIKLKWEQKRGSKLKLVSGQILPDPPLLPLNVTIFDRKFDTYMYLKVGKNSIVALFQS